MFERRQHIPTPGWARWIPIAMCAIGLFLFGAGLDERQHANRILIELALCVPVILLLARNSIYRLLN